MDGASNSKEADNGIVLTTLKGSVIEQSFTFGFPMSNNKVEYEAVLARLRETITLEVTRVEVQCDSSLIVNQVRRKHRKRFLDDRVPKLVLKLKSKVPRCDLRWVPRTENNNGDSLANLAAATEFQFRIKSPLIISSIRASNN